MISVVVPTRKRPELVRRLAASAKATAAGRVQFCFYVDDDDPSPLPLDLVDANLSMGWIRGPRIVLSQMWNRAAMLAGGDILMHCGDDITFNTPGWDARVRAEFDCYPDRLVLVHGNDLSPWGWKLATHSFVSREWMDTLGYLVPPYFSSDYNDTWLTEVADALGRRVYLPDVVTEHHHWAFRKMEIDENADERLARHAADRVDDLYLSLAHERAEDVAKLRRAIEKVTA